MGRVEGKKGKGKILYMHIYICIISHCISRGCLLAL